ncbi:ABC transporter ATP-binding protein [Ramlibacter rhizophilus]|uniref:ATP-binding cassette domain-containing protein n=1 Tax=Ramlibacter rhizophilus TaxID=1781167 RepID=A0A4Z0C0D9_9BURK|nr:oligopeptide/dipeptide ABC transporter ATP-binding protein [Ramlibacter rhizophilus]TFZ04996.1 ATP-binding cassette domain-containing protein [Ramlibacter rhizophilus]
MSTPLLQVRDLAVEFRLKRGLLRPARTLQAVRGVSFDIERGQTYGLVGESGSGKTTIGRAILRLVPSSGGSIVFDGQDIGAFGRHTPLAYRRDVQVVFQDPMSSVNPRQSVGTTLAQAIARHRPMDADERRREVRRLVDSVGLASYYTERYPHELSGGQRQRVAIARALAVRPRLIVCDEPVSALDVSTQAQVINLLVDLQREFGLSYLFIAHNLDVVRHISHRIGVLYLGRLVEQGGAEAVHGAPSHPYTRMLMASTLVADPKVQAQRSRERRGQVRSELPSPLAPPTGCAFHTRCAWAAENCRTVMPLLQAAPQAGVQGACHRLREVAAPRAGAPLEGATA